MTGFLEASFRRSSFPSARRIPRYVILWVSLILKIIIFFFIHVVALPPSLKFTLWLH
ncbi:hypothetical protein M413DRAFT_201828 [Hebeloma cylindrosporum]|uniref:Uncharacterized protein n=1 Tax=Hebeloma cylindrosporum TaxID=76867 RepID=A0A0C2Z2M0_HEBCY|nr:hypothetical protein M413DRAFT_201828 [Hebeloma cylindrosporum h7]